MADYAIIAIGGKQYRVREGERFVVDRVAAEEGKTINPQVLFVGGNGGSATVTARVVGHVKGDKVRIFKYRPKNGYRKRGGFRAALTELQIERIGAKSAAKPKAEQPKAEPAPKKTTGRKPTGYAEMTVAQVQEGAPTWTPSQLNAALEYERENANRKGAIAAIESALAAKEKK